MQDPFFGFGCFNEGGFGVGQTRVIRRVYVSSDSPTQLPTLDPFPTSRFRTMLPTHRRFFDDDDDDDSPSSPPSKLPDSSMITRHYYIVQAPRYDENHKPPPKAKVPHPRYDEYYRPPPKGYYGDGGNPVNVHVNLSMGPQGLQAPNQNANSHDNANSNHNASDNDNSQAGPPGWPYHSPQFRGVPYNPNIGYYDSQTGPPGGRRYYPQVERGNYNPNGYYNSQTGGGDYNPQVQGGNKVDGDGKITMGPEMGNIKIEGGKAGEGQTGGGN